jgi:hypothetical protein
MEVGRTTLEMNLFVKSLARHALVLPVVLILVKWHIKTYSTMS